jgi:Flp pilus assembly protein TadG
MLGFKRFNSDMRGNTAIMTALAIVPVMLAAGAGIDMLRANNAQTVLQAAADAAAIAGATSSLTDQGALKVVVEDYLKANGAIDVLSSVDKIEGKLDKTKRTFEVKIRGKLKTSLMAIAGISNMDLGAYAEVVMGGNALEVALVLDNTGSMNSGGRLAALKVAATDLITKLMVLKASGADVKFGIVPFGEYVNVGKSNKGQPWLKVPSDSSTKVNVCNTTYPDAKSSNCRDETGVYDDDGIPTSYTYQVCDWDYGTPLVTCSDQTTTNSWSGCVGSRPEPIDETISSPGTPYPGLLNTSCPSEITGLIGNESKLKSQISAMTAVGSTYIPQGILWGWNVLDSSQPITGARTNAAMKAAGGTKVMVVMTDGANTRSAVNQYHSGSDVADLKTASLCRNVKSDEIKVFTVAFMVTDASAKKLLKDCASDSSMAYDASSAAELAKAFDDIGSSLMALRLSK